MLKESLQCFRELDDPWGIALATTYFGITWAYGPGTENEARPVLAEGRARFQALEDDWGLSTSSHYLGSIAMRQGNFAAARELTEEMLNVARGLGDNYRISRNLHQLAEIAVAERKNSEAVGLLKASLALNREQGRIGDGAQQLRLLARLENMRQRPDRAVRLFAAASLHKSKESTLPPDDPALNKSALESARQALEGHRVESEWALGLAMSFDQVVSWTLAD